METEKKGKGSKVVIIIFILLLLGLCGWVTYYKFFNKQSDVPENNNQTNNENNNENNNEEKEEYDYTLSKYGILSYGEVNPFKNLDFSKKEYGENVKLEDDVIKYSSDDSEDDIEILIEDIIQVGTNCDCGGCRNIYYLKSNGELYSIKLDHGDLNEDYETKLIESNVSAFTLIESGIIESTTCGGNDLIVKYNDGTAKILMIDIDDNVSTYDLSQLERYWIEEAGYENELFIVSENAKVKNYLTNENNEKLVAKQVFIKELVEIVGEETITKYSIYILDKDDNLYYTSDLNKTKLNLHEESKVKTVRINDSNISITYLNGTTEVIDVSLVYDYEKGLN